jgi:hypothetical protein
MIWAFDTSEAVVSSTGACVFSEGDLVLMGAFSEFISLRGVTPAICCYSWASWGR